jgi:predicted lipoprotein with Yx(FWY)xxD motif
VHVATDAKMGQILVDKTGLTLYHFDKDKPGAIACTGACTSTWPPVLLTGGSQPTGVDGLGTAPRPDGTTQVTYKGMPVYRYKGDSKAGDTNGDGIAGLWHVTKVSA